MTCVLCKSIFFDNTPPGSCDCGANFRQRDLDELTPDERERLLTEHDAEDEQPPACSRCGQDYDETVGCVTCYQRDYCEGPRLSETGQF